MPIKTSAECGVLSAEDWRPAGYEDRPCRRPMVKGFG
jgi:hypothetical protein